MISEQGHIQTTDAHTKQTRKPHPLESLRHMFPKQEANMSQSQYVQMVFPPCAILICSTLTHKHTEILISFKMIKTKNCNLLNHLNFYLTDKSTDKTFSVFSIIVFCKYKKRQNVAPATHSKNVGIECVCLTGLLAVQICLLLKMYGTS